MFYDGPGYGALPSRMGTRKAIVGGRKGRPLAGRLPDHLRDRESRHRRRVLRRGRIAGTHADWVGIVLAVIGVYLLIAIGIFCGVGLTAFAARALDGHDTTIGEGLAAARQRQA
jgi:hypothetical protein